VPKSYVRPRGGRILLDPETGAPTVPADALYETDHPLVKAYPDAFISDAEAYEAQEAGRHRPPEAVQVERATKRPGEKRATKRS
jgi:hypothetical protein